jgi:hypothetical protein
MPATVLADPPGIRCMFSDGSTPEFRLEGLPCPQLVSDLLTGLVELIHPHGSLDSANSVDLSSAPRRSPSGTESPYARAPPTTSIKIETLRRVTHARVTHCVGAWQSRPGGRR